MRRTFWECRPHREGPTWPPGRGLWVTGGEVQTVQVALVDH